MGRKENLSGLGRIKKIPGTLGSLATVILLYFFFHVLNLSYNIIFVGLGCPKQELWINNQSGKIKGVLLGVGAAFNFYAGDLKRAPSLFKDNGFEWLYRIFQEPKRLFFRYLSIVLSKDVAFILPSSKEIIPF